MLQVHLIKPTCVLQDFYVDNALDAGVAGFEPADHRVRACCLTAWLHPISLIFYLSELVVLNQLYTPNHGVDQKRIVPSRFQGIPAKSRP